MSPPLGHDIGEADDIEDLVYCERDVSCRLGPTGQLVVPVMFTVAAVVAWVVALVEIDVRNVGDIGFASATGPMLFVALGLLVAGFCVALFRDSLCRWLLAVQVVILVVMLHGTVGIVEPEPRFPTAWIHAGFADYLAHTGDTIPSLDARFSWPGFFSLTGLAAKAAGLETTMAFLRFAPVAFNLAYLVPLSAIGAVATANPRARWLALWLFVLANWIGQDYFAPQALSFFLFLTFLAVVLRWFRSTDDVGTDTRKGRRLLRALTRVAPDEVPTAAAEATAFQRGLLVAALIGIFGVIVVSHQLTPVFLLGALTLLAVAGRSSLRRFPVLMAVLFIAWLSYGGAAYWSGHLDVIFSAFGHLGRSLGQNLGERIGGDPSRQFVLFVRLGFTALVCLLALVGFVRRLRVGQGDLTLALLAVSPFFVLTVQGYGGEALLRAYLFSLPFCTLFGAFAFLPTSDPRRLRLVGALAAVVSILAFSAFLVARYGNERFEMVTSPERAAVEHLTEVAPPGARLLAIAPSIAWRHEALQRYEYQTPDQDAVLSDPTEVDDFVTRKEGPVYVIVTRSQEAYGELVDGLPGGWTATVVHQLLATGRYHMAFANEDAQILVPSTGAGTTEVEVKR